MSNFWAIFWARVTQESGPALKVTELLAYSCDSLFLGCLSRIAFVKTSNMEKC